MSIGGIAGNGSPTGFSSALDHRLDIDILSQSAINFQLSTSNLHSQQPSNHHRFSTHQLADLRPISAGHAPIFIVRRTWGETEISPHGHDFVEIGLVLSGHGSHVSGDGERILQCGDCYVVRPGAWHAHRTGDRAVVWNCCIATDFLEEDLGFLRRDPHLNALLWAGSASSGRFDIFHANIDAAHLHECERHFEELAYKLSMPLEYRWPDEVGHLITLLGELGRGTRFESIPSATPVFPVAAANSIHAAVVKATTLLNSDFKTEWSLESLAEECRIDHFHLIRLFREQVGMPPMAYRTSRRLEHAASLLLKNDHQIGEVAAAVGWDDQNYFARRFKAHFGLSPTEYRVRAVRTS